MYHYFLTFQRSKSTTPRTAPRFNESDISGMISKFGNKYNRVTELTKKLTTFWKKSLFCEAYTLRTFPWPSLVKVKVMICGPRKLIKQIHNTSIKNQIYMGDL